MDQDFMETYQQRMSEIQDVSGVIAAANLQLGKLLQKFRWTKTSLQENKVSLLECPIDNNHVVKKENMKDHMTICMQRKKGVLSVAKEDLLPSSSSFCYENTNIVSVILGKDEYSKIGVMLPEELCLDGLQQQDDNMIQQNTAHTVVEETLIDDRDEIIQYKPCDSLDELRFIYSWTNVPPKYSNVDISDISYENTKAWLHDNIPDAADTGNKNKSSIVNFVINHLKDMQSPDAMLVRLKPVLKAKARGFVLKLWKFVCAKNLCAKSHIAEHTRNEFDFYGTTLLSSSKQDEALSKKPYDVFSLLTNEWTFYRLSREQKLKIYEHVIQIGKVICEEEQMKFEELKAQTEEQMKVITDFEMKNKGEKTHLEVMAELRDYKRRRLSYRGKNKDSRKMSGIEILRELVEQQMLYLKILYQQQNPSSHTKQPDKETTEVNAADVVQTDRQEDTVLKNRSEKSRHDSRDGHKKRYRSRSRDRRSRSRDRSRHHRPGKSHDIESRLHSKSRECRSRRSRSRDRRGSVQQKRKSDVKDDGRQCNAEGEISNITYYSNNET